MDHDISKSFGAEVRLSLPESNQLQLFFVRSSSPDVDLPALMRGGRVVLDGKTWVIVEFGFREATELRKTRGVASVGGIALDPERFAAFCKVTGTKSS